MLSCGFGDFARGCVAPAESRLDSRLRLLELDDPPSVIGTSGEALGTAEVDVVGAETAA
jgi:hypothetical protein